MECFSIPFETPTSFLDIPLEVKPILYKELSLMQLIELVKMHPSKQPAAEISFKNKFTHSHFEIENYGNKTIGTFMMNEKILETMDFDKTLETFRTFGNLMTKLKINFYRLCQQPEKVRKLNEHITAYLSGSLTEIILEEVFDNCLVGFLGPFTKAVNVSLLYGRFNSNATNFTEIFPAIQEIHLYGMAYVNPRTLESHFPQLEFVEFENKLPKHSPNETSDLERRLKSNPQFKYLSFHFIDLDDFEVLSKNAPNLERLRVHHLLGPCDEDREIIRFEHLKTLAILYNSIFIKTIEMMPIEFNNLVEFECVSQSIAPWINIIAKNKQMKKLSLGSLTKDEIDQIIEQFPFLKEFSMSLLWDDSFEPFRKLLNNANKLKMFSFFKKSSESIDAFISEMTTKWNVTTEGNKVTLYRD